MSPFDVAAYGRLRSATRVGARVAYREQTGSTMDDARQGTGGCGTAYVAGAQTGGRGRRGRTWVSSAASGLYVTYHLCPRDAEHAPLLSIAGAMAVGDAVNTTSGLATTLKWPNDVLCDGRKLAGVLAEARHGDRVDVFLGIGINIRVSPDLPPDVAAIATSIEGAGAPPPSREALLAALSDALERWADQAEAGPEGLIAAWRDRLVTLGQRVRLSTPGGTVEGDAVDVSPRGEIVLRLDGGETASFAAGDVTTV